MAQVLICLSVCLSVVEGSDYFTYCVDGTAFSLDLKRTTRTEWHLKVPSRHFKDLQMDYMERCERYYIDI